MVQIRFQQFEDEIERVEKEIVGLQKVISDKSLGHGFSLSGTCFA